MTRGAQAAEMKRVNRLMDLANILNVPFVATCDWGHQPNDRAPAVAYRKSGGTWLAVCEKHTGGSDDPKKVRR